MNSLLALLPSGVIFLGALILLLCEAFIRRENKEYLGYMALASLALGAAPLYSEPEHRPVPALEDSTCASLAAGLATGIWTSEARVRAFQARIRKLDAAGPALHSVIELNPEALAIAKALDPGFNEACFIRERKLAEGELAGLGFSPAKAPAGYKLESSNLMASEIGAACPKPDVWEPNYSRNWTCLGGATVIQASANRYGTSGSSDGAGYQSSNYLSWTSRGGTQFSVNAYSKGISPDVDKDDLVAVAKSMDPTFDLSKLDEQPDGIDLPAPMPAEKSSR